MRQPRVRWQRSWVAAVATLPFILIIAGKETGTAPANTACDARDGRAHVPAGTALFGEDGPGRPGQNVSVPEFWIDRHEVTNRQFAVFVKATGYRTHAERDGQSAVFVPPGEPVPLDHAARWWRFVRGADWRHPKGPDSRIADRANDPVVHVDRRDAEAYARWAGGRLPTEVQWERAARGTQDRPVGPATWAFGTAEAPLANVWQGSFPTQDTGEDGFKGIAPAGCFAANAFGIHDMVGNVWEWVAGDGEIGLVKGGSFLCAAHYCANFRPAAFQEQEQDLGTSHIGFRVVYDRAEVEAD